MYKIIKDAIFRISDSSSIPCDINNKDYIEYLDWIGKGGAIELDAEETKEQKIIRLEFAVDKHLNEQAQSLRYESIKTIVSYRDDPNPKFKAEGIAGYQLRSAVYTSSIKLLEDVTNGLKDIPTEAELIASLPKITDFLQYE